MVTNVPSGGNDMNWNIWNESYFELRIKTYIAWKFDSSNGDKLSLFSKLRKEVKFEHILKQII